MREIKMVNHGIKMSQIIDSKTLSKEIVVLGLRTLEGIPLENANHILDIERINELVKDGFFDHGTNGNRLVPTSKGLQVMDSILPMILK
jgi:coproporphyrinogen III oxidase-like Fe-S oxidoreductase